MFRNKTASQHNFATVPRADIPRSKFPMRQTRKQAFDASELVPIMCEEVLPGDTWSHKESLLARLATPIAPLLDDLDLETFYFFVPNRIVWDRWEQFITGENKDLYVPTLHAFNQDGSNAAVIEKGAIDHFGIPVGTYTQIMDFTALPIRAYFKIFNDWFRDQNLQEEWIVPNLPDAQTNMITKDGVSWDQMCLRANKRHDMFTGSLPWPQKGDPVMLPLGSTAPVTITAVPGTGPSFNVGGQTNLQFTGNGTNSVVQWTTASPVTSTPNATWNTPNLTGVTDLALATSATINAIRLAFQTQKLLERDARGGSRYVEQLNSHWGVRSPDYRLQRPEYLGGSKIPITINPIAQTAAYAAEPGANESAIGNLGAEMHASGSKHTFNYAATEHGYIIGLALVRATPTYQQGLRRHWSRRTRLDFFFPVFGHIGERAIATREIYQPLTVPLTNETWGYQEAWAEYRYTPNEITGVLRSTAAQPLDWWHLAEEFANEPALNEEFMEDKTRFTLARSLATAPSEQWSAQIIMDILHESNVARLMPTYSDPGYVDHF